METKTGYVMWVALGVTLIGELFDALDSLITTVAGPSIVRDLGGDGSFIQWLSAGYTIAMAAGLLVGGRLGDMFGRRRVFLTGMAGFTLMSTLASLAQSPGQLIAVRVLQGLLGALMVPQTFGIYRDIFPADKLSQAFALVGPVMGLAGMAGPLAAGAILDADVFGLGWRALFVVNIPFCAAALLIGLQVLPSNDPDKTLTLDWGSAVVAALGLPAILYALVEGRELDWPLWVFGLAAAGAVLLAAFVWRQSKREAAGRTPLLEPSLFHNKTFIGGLIYGLAIFGASMSVGLLVPVYAQLGLGLSPFRASLLTIPDMIGMIVGMGLLGTLGSTRRTMRIGSLGMVLGSSLLAGAAALGGDSTPAWTLLPGLAVLGVSTGLTVGPYFDMVITGVSDKETGSASGALTASQQFSAAFGIAVFGSLFFGIASHGSGELGYSRGLGWSMGAIVAVLAVSTFALQLLPERAKPQDEEEALSGNTPTTQVV